MIFLKKLSENTDKVGGDFYRLLASNETLVILIISLSYLYGQCHNPECNASPL